MIVSSGISFDLFFLCPLFLFCSTKFEQTKIVESLEAAFVLRALGRMNTYDTYMFMDLGRLPKVWSTIDKEVNAIPLVKIRT